MPRWRTLLSLLAVLAGAMSAQARTDVAGNPVSVVVTVEGQKGSAPPNLTRDDVMVSLDNQRMRVTDWSPILSGPKGLQLWVLIDDSTATSVGTQFEDLRKFALEQSPATEIGIGYIQNGRVERVQPLTTDHAAAAKAIRLPLGQPGISASPYLALVDDLLKKWPRGQQAREIIMVTSGIDPNNGPGPINPYLDEAVDMAQRAGVVVHSIYYASAGHFGHSYWQIYWGQNYLAKITEESGGEFFWQGDANPVSFSPYLSELNEHFHNQYILTFASDGKSGFRRLKLSTEVPHVSLVGPAKVYVGK
jgi:hypothetical protein